MNFVGIKISENSNVRYQVRILGIGGHASQIVSILARFDKRCEVWLCPNGNNTLLINHFEMIFSSITFLNLTSDSAEGTCNTQYFSNPLQYLGSSSLDANWLLELLIVTHCILSLISFIPNCCKHYFFMACNSCFLRGFFFFFKSVICYI